MFKYNIGTYIIPDIENWEYIENDVIMSKWGDVINWIKDNLKDYQLIRELRPDPNLFYDFEATIVVDIDSVDDAILYKLAFFEGDCK